MTIAELIAKLDDIKDRFGDDPEAAHGFADDALLEYIGNTEVTIAYGQIPMWYA